MDADEIAAKELKEHKDYSLSASIDDHFLSAAKSDWSEGLP